jgi:serine/threonine protein kinase
MALATGEKLGRYEIVERIGRGGMGEVYRARDPRLGRDVAIKVSVERFTDRFDREARVIAFLNHPNISTLHDVGPNYLVMELVEGETLAERISLYYAAGHFERNLALHRDTQLAGRAEKIEPSDLTVGKKLLHARSPGRRVLAFHPSRCPSLVFSIFLHARGPHFFRRVYEAYV